MGPMHVQIVETGASCNRCGQAINRIQRGMITWDGISAVIVH